MAAATALLRILDGSEHSNVVVDELRRDLADPDAAQLQRVVFGALRHLEGIHVAIQSSAGRRLDDLDPEVRAILRAGATELLVDGGEPHGVVDSAVEAIRALGRPRAAGFVNAVLRRISRDRPSLPIRTMPEWVIRRLEDQFEPDEVERAVAALDEPAARGIRVRRGEMPAGAQPAEGIPGAAYLPPGIEVDEGAVDFIDPASTAVAHAAAVEPGMAVLDVASAPGGKTAALWDAMDGRGRLVAADRQPGRLRTARKRLLKMGMSPLWVVADGTNPPFRRGSFDVVVLDAPCTGIGTLRRRPEIRHRLRPGDPERMGDLQRRLLDSSLELVKPGGRLVYSVCTFFDEETTSVVADRAAHGPAGLPGATRGNGLLLGPHITGTDGMFISVIEA